MWVIFINKDTVERRKGGMYFERRIQRIDGKADCILKEGFRGKKERMHVGDLARRIQRKYCRKDERGSVGEVKKLLNG